MVSFLDLRVWIIHLSFPNLVRRILASPDLGRWVGYLLALGQGVSPKHGRKRMKERAWFLWFQLVAGWDPIYPGRWRLIAVGGDRWKGWT